MKKIIIYALAALLTMLMMATGSRAYSQKVYNFDTMSVKNLHTKEKAIGEATLTKDVVVYKAISYPVYISRNQKLFFVIQSASGNWYKKYIKE